MKKLLLLALLVAVANNLIAQADYDCLGRNEFYIIKTSSCTKNNTTKASEIKNSKIAEQLFGMKYKEQKQFAETEDTYYKVMTYEDGLELRIP